jgi:hypothetical protein
MPSFCRLTTGNSCGGGADAGECDDHLEQAAPEQNSDNVANRGSASDCRTAVP